ARRGPCGQGAGRSLRQLQRRGRGTRLRPRPGQGRRVHLRPRDPGGAGVRAGRAGQV
ncbi:MAG: Transcription antitermination protein NusG, partial [uncultured Sphingomonas sp.]